MTNFNAFLWHDPERLPPKDGPLGGMKISVKDNIGVAGGPTTGATPAFKHLDLGENNAITRLREAGAHIIGKTNMQELAFGITGQNAHSGNVLNPFDPGRLPGGSSSGAAASVAAGLCQAAIGTDTGGSCRIPAAHCGIVGWRPSIGRYASNAIITLSETRDTLGILAGNVGDIMTLDSIMAGGAGPIAPAKDIRLGVVPPASFFPAADAHVLACYEEGLDALAAAGMTLVDADLSEAIQAHEECGFVIALYETARSIEALSQKALGLNLADFAKTIASPDVRALFESQTGPDKVPQAAYDAAVSTALPALRAAFSSAMESAGVDALVYPTVLVPPPPQDVGEMMQIAGGEVPVFPATTATTGPDSTAGQPSISLPCGLAKGLPVGLMLCGAIGADEKLLRIALAAEAALPTAARPGD